MSRSTEALQEQFVCVKCHNHGCTAEEVALAGGALSRMLPVGASKFVALSCSLCGYTEFYNLAAITHVEEPEVGKAEMVRGMEKA